MDVELQEQESFCMSSERVSLAFQLSSSWLGSSEPTCKASKGWKGRRTISGTREQCTREVGLISRPTRLLMKAQGWAPGTMNPQAVRIKERLQKDKGWCQRWASAEPPQFLPRHFFCLEIQVLPKLCFQKMRRLGGASGAQATPWISHNFPVWTFLWVLSRAGEQESPDCFYLN